MTEFPRKQWTRSGLESLIRKVDATGSAERTAGSGRPKSTRTPANVAKVEELICIQDDQPGTHKSPWEIERITGIHRSLVRRIVKNFKFCESRLCLLSNIIVLATLTAFSFH